MSFYTTLDNATSNFYGIANLESEVDLRKDLDELLNKRGELVILRRATMEDGSPRRCECRKNSRSNEPDLDIKCQICNGLGYVSKDFLLKTYFNHSLAYSVYRRDKPAGSAAPEPRTIYFRYDALKEAGESGDFIPNRYDRVLRLEYGLEGNLISPLKLREQYNILSVDPYRLDNNGRMEYYRLRIMSIEDGSFLV